MADGEVRKTFPTWYGLQTDSCEPNLQMFSKAQYSRLNRLMDLLVRSSSDMPGESGEGERTVVLLDTMVRAAC